MSFYDFLKKLFKKKSRRGGSEDCSEDKKEISQSGDCDGQHYIVKIGEKILDQYEVDSIIGKGTFGQVVKAFDHEEYCYVAIKIIKQMYFDHSHNEVKTLKMLNKADIHNKHSIVQLKRNFIWKDHMCLVFELLSYDLFEFIRKTNFRGVPLRLTKTFAHQLCTALHFLSLPEINIIHCDIKPQNIAFCDLKKATIKIIDFGASCINGPGNHYYIQSRYYRSPEILLGLPYDQAIDMWSLGCTLVELHTGLPLFMGSSKLDQMNKIVEVLGMPSKDILNDANNTREFFKLSNGDYVLRQSKKKKKHLPGTRRLHNILLEVYGNHCSQRLGTRGNSVSDFCNFKNLIYQMLDYNPKTRLTPYKALQHDFFKTTIGEEAKGSVELVLKSKI